MRDNYGDKITVKCDGEEVHIAVDDRFRPGDETSIGALTPAKARKLAKKLKAAANEIDPPAPVATAGSLGLCGDSRVVFSTPRYVLDLSVEEAETLAVILSRIGGANGYDGKASARVYASSVADKLDSLGLNWLTIRDRPEYEVDESAARGGINFVDFPIADDEPDTDPDEPRSGGCCGGVCG